MTCVYDAGQMQGPSLPKVKEKGLFFSLKGFMVDIL
jgi:hypothetical protein